MAKEWYSVELSKEDADEFKDYLISHSIEYEPSEAYSLIHFECLMDTDELYLANKWLLGDV